MTECTFCHKIYKNLNQHITKSHKNITFTIYDNSDDDKITCTFLVNGNLLNYYEERGTWDACEYDNVFYFNFTDNLIEYCVIFNKTTKLCNFLRGKQTKNNGIVHNNDGYQHNHTYRIVSE